MLAEFWLHADDQFSTISVTDSNGAVVERYDYHDYGFPLILDAEGVPAGVNAQGMYASKVGNPRLFTGREWDAEAKLYHYRTRAYHPGLGRFLQIDRIGVWGDRLGIGNAYAGFACDPFKWLDPSGRGPDDWSVGADGLALLVDATVRMFSDKIKTVLAVPVKKIYTGSSTTSDENYDKAVQAAGDWVEKNSPLRGFYGGVGEDVPVDVPGIPGSQPTIGVGGQWTIDNGGEGWAYGGLGLSGGEDGFTPVPDPGVGDTSGMESDFDGPVVFIDPTTLKPTTVGAFVGRHQSHGGGVHLGTENDGTVYIGLDYGPLWGGLVVDPSKLKNLYGLNEQGDMDRFLEWLRRTFGFTPSPNSTSDGCD